MQVCIVSIRSRKKATHFYYIPSYSFAWPLYIVYHRCFHASIAFNVQMFTIVDCTKTLCTHHRFLFYFLYACEIECHWLWIRFRWKYIMKQWRMNDPIFFFAFRFANTETKRKKISFNVCADFYMRQCLFLLVKLNACTLLWQFIHFHLKLKRFIKEKHILFVLRVRQFSDHIWCI